MTGNDDVESEIGAAASKKPVFATITDADLLQFELPSPRRAPMNGFGHLINNGVVMALITAFAVGFLLGRTLR
jgi:hypothetical protein